MKKLFYPFLVALTCSLAFTFVSCSDDDDSDDDNNAIILDGTSYQVRSATQKIYDGDEENKTLNIELELQAIDDVAIWFDLWVPETATRIPAGTYKMSNDEESMTWSEAYIFREGTSSDFDHEITSGTLTVSLSGSTYHFSFSGRTKNGKTVTARFEGPATVQDKR